MPDATCSVDGCAKLQKSRSLCPMHYQRQRIWGDLGPAGPTRQKNVGACSVAGCGQPMRKTGWCASHYAQWQREGTVRPFSYKWSTERRCVVCGAEHDSPKRRKVCSPACQQMLHRHGGEAPDPPCVMCGSPMLRPTGGRGRRRRADATKCHACRRRRPALSAEQLAVRDGPNCAGCGTAVDLALAYPHVLSGVADHIVPLALGGSDTDPTNLQLMHASCNARKGSRLLSDWQMTLL